MHSNPPSCHSHHCVIHHHVVCRHQTEIEVYPPNADVYFADERYIDAINTQVRFHASVYNAPGNSVTWQVINASGGPGLGSIDPTGEYTAPVKGLIASGHTDIVVATVKHDPTRYAIAKVTLLGHGPEPVPQATLEIFPKLSHIYYQNGYGAHNQYIDTSNKHQQFRNIIKHSASTAVSWSVYGAGYIDAAGFYSAPATGPSPASVEVHAQLTHNPSITAAARIILLNYHWPGII